MNQTIYILSFSSWFHHFILFFTNISPKHHNQDLNVFQLFLFFRLWFLYLLFEDSTSRMRYNMELDHLNNNDWNHLAYNPHIYFTSEIIASQISKPMIYHHLLIHSDLNPFQILLSKNQLKTQEKTKKKFNKANLGFPKLYLLEEAEIKQWK